MRQRVMVVRQGVRREVVELERTGEEIEWLVVVVAGEGAEVDLELRVVHKGRMTKGVVWVRGVVEGKASVRVKGIASLEASAVGSESSVRQEILVVSPDAVVDSRPELLIGTSEVVGATHAATVGMIDQNMTNYLQSRGMSVKEAEKVVVAGFLRSIVERIGDVGERGRVSLEVGLD